VVRLETLRRLKEQRDRIVREPEKDEEADLREWVEL